MAYLYSKFETNTDESSKPNQSTKKIDIIFDLETNKNTVLDSEYSKNIVCVCGSCDLLLENNGEKDSITLNDHKVTINLKKDIKAELKNYTKDARLVVQYLGENNG